MLRDSNGVVVDSLNYGGLSDPWAAKGFQAEAGERSEGCFVPSPEPGGSFGMNGAANAINRSAGRYPDGADTDSNCTDFVVAPATVLPLGSAAGSSAIKVASVARFRAGDEVTVGAGTDAERAVVASVGSAGATTTGKDVEASATVVPVASAYGFEEGQTVTVGSGSDTETVSVASIRRFEGFALVLAKPLTQAHTAGSQVAGTGLTLASALTRAHTAGAQVAASLPTPGAPNQAANQVQGGERQGGMQ